ncbi:hypothetical protein BGW80DRAFT_1561526 [Lactifluus volemus]|nr:hypothetical protein BGW80DRAFT_1561526 [Lactifluus volemus]
MLARSGVALRHLIDVDYVTLSSSIFTLQPPSLTSGRRKYKLWRGGADGCGAPSECIDAIDNIAKVELLAYCAQNNIKAFSSMGAGTISDPTRIQIADLSAAHHDPLARAVRKRLRAVLSRSERPSPPTPRSYPPLTPTMTHLQPRPRPYLPPPRANTQSCNDVTLLPLANSELPLGRRERAGASARLCVLIFPVLGLLPALFGLHIVTYVLCELASRPLERPLPVRHRKKLYERMSKDLLHRESRIPGKQIKYAYLSSPFGFAPADDSLLYDDFALGRSIVPPHSVCVRPVLVRWDPRVLLSLENRVMREIKEVSRAMSRVFAMPDADAMYEIPWVPTERKATPSRSIPLGSRMGSLSGGVGRRGCSCRAVSYCAGAAVS